MANLRVNKDIEFLDRDLKCQISLVALARLPIVTRYNPSLASIY
jgi:hypothetical protein